MNFNNGKLEIRLVVNTDSVLRSTCWCSAFLPRSYTYAHKHQRHFGTRIFDFHHSKWTNRVSYRVVFFFRMLFMINTKHTHHFRVQQNTFQCVHTNSKCEFSGANRTRARVSPSALRMKIPKTIFNSNYHLLRMLWTKWQIFGVQNQ